MEEANYEIIALFITNKLGKDKAILAVVLSGAFLPIEGFFICCGIYFIPFNQYTI